MVGHRWGHETFDGKSASRDALFHALGAGLFDGNLTVPAQGSYCYSVLQRTVTYAVPDSHNAIIIKHHRYCVKSDLVQIELL